MDIIITGATGFIGKNLVEFLSIEHRIIALSRHLISSSHSKNRVNVQCDLENCSETIKCIKEATETHVLNPSIIIHLASKMANSENLTDLGVLQSNQMISQTVAAVTEEFELKQVINFSSSAVYPNIDGVFSEESAVDPSKNNDCVYGLSKLNGEVLINYLLKGSEVSIQHLRVAIVDGDGARSDRLIPSLERDITERSSVTLFGNGERLINYVTLEYLMIVVSSLLGCLTNYVFNVVEYSKSLIELANDIAQNNNIHSLKIELKERGNKSKFRLDSTKLNKFLSNV